jgi:phosphoglycolate phosphatase
VGDAVKRLESADMRAALGRNVLLVDLDGTLIDSAEGVVGCFRLALAEMGRIVPPEVDLSWVVGPPLRQSFAGVLGGTADPEEALGLYRSCYEAEGLFRAVVYDGAPEALSRLTQSGVRLVPCTSKPAVYAARILARLDLDRYFEKAYGSELDGRLEGKGDLIGHILADRALDPSECVMLGDRKHDVAGAMRHAIPTIGALWGYGGEKELREAGAAALCAAPRDIPSAFARFARATAHATEAQHDR